MSIRLIAVGTLALALGYGSVAQAQNLSAQDRLFLFTTYYSTYKQTQKLEQGQQNLQMSFYRFERQQQQQQRLAPPLSPEEFARLGATPPLRGRPLPQPQVGSNRPVSRGGASSPSGSYFMRAPYFNPPQGR